MLNMKISLLYVLRVAALVIKKLNARWVRKGLTVPKLIMLKAIAQLNSNVGDIMDYIHNDNHNIIPKSPAYYPWMLVQKKRRQTNVKTINLKDKGSKDPGGYRPTGRGPISLMVIMGQKVLRFNLMAQAIWDPLNLQIS